METIGTTRGPFDPEADAEDVPRANGVYVPGEPDPERAAVCPDCGFPTVWELQDTHEIGGERFSERLQVCDIACGWTGANAWFPWRWMKDAYVVADSPYRPPSLPRS